MGQPPIDRSISVQVLAYEVINHSFPRYVNGTSLMKFAGVEIYICRKERTVDQKYKVVGKGKTEHGLSVVIPCELCPGSSCVRDGIHGIECII